MFDFERVLIRATFHWVCRSPYPRKVLRRSAGGEDPREVSPPVVTHNAAMGP